MSTIYLSFLYYQYLLKKQSFIICILVLIILGLLLVPNNTASYVTFYMGNISPTPNKFWIGNLCAIFSNIIISFLVLHLINGERETEILNNTYIYYDNSIINSFNKALFKIFGLFGISMSFLLILNITIFLQNYRAVNLIYFMLPLIYFSVPFLFFVSVLSYSCEFYIKKNFFKFFIYYIFILFVIFNDKYFISAIGIHELYTLITKNLEGISKFAIGYLPKSKTNIISLESPIIPTLWFNKLFLFLISLVVIYIISKISINRKVSTINPLKESYYSKVSANNFDSIKFDIQIKWSFFNLLQKDLYLFGFCFTKTTIFGILLVWFLLIFTKDDLFIYLLPILFLFTLPTNFFLHRLAYYNLTFFERLSPYSNFEIGISKVFIIYFFYIILLIPLLLKFTFSNSIHILLNFLILTVIQVLISKIFINKTLIDILLIILYATYLTGNPIINIFLL